MESSLQKVSVNQDDLPKDPFTVEQMLEHWNDYSNRLSKAGHMMMFSLMGLCKLKLDVYTIVIELPNEGSRLGFAENQYELVNYLRKKLNNYDIDIKIIVNEEIKIKRVFTPEDKYHHLNKINPSLELLVRTFKLDVTKM